MSTHPLALVPSCHLPFALPSSQKKRRLSVPQKEGKLGDMSMLRGRVLGDEEATKYWEQRGAEPGGLGVREGIFRDDPASRSTQRRGAPGRKAWVKPAPKPPVDAGKVKDLEAKRNFLALKVWSLCICCRRFFSALCRMVRFGLWWGRVVRLGRVLPCLALFGPVWCSFSFQLLSFSFCFPPATPPTLQDAFLRLSLIHI